MGASESQVALRLPSCVTRKSERPGAALRLPGWHPGRASGVQVTARPRPPRRRLLSESSTTPCDSLNISERARWVAACLLPLSAGVAAPEDRDTGGRH